MYEPPELTSCTVEEPVVPMSPQDVKYWEIVERVRAAFSGGCNTTKDACSEAGVARSTYYIALKCPYVQQKMAEQMDALAQASLEILERSWLRTLMNMASIATSGTSKEAVQAARFIRDVKKDLEAIVGGKEPSSGESEAARALRSFLGGKSLKLRHVTVTQEVEVGNEELSDGNFVEGEVRP